MTADKPPPAASFLYEEAARELKEQFDWIDTLDTKAGILLAAGGVIAGLVLTRDSMLLWAPPLITVAIVAALGVSLSFALLAFGTRHYQLAPDVQDLWPAMASATEAELKWESFPDILEAIDINQPKLNQKATFLFWSGASLLIGAGLFAGFFIWFILGL